MANTNSSNNNFYNNDSSQDNTQSKYKNNQDILNIDFDSLYNNFIVPVDAIRSHFNALVPNSQELNTPQYQESRCHAFYRMIGFPVVADAGNFYSPGYDPNLNLDKTSTAAYQKIANAVINNLSLTSQFAFREQQVQIYFNKIFANSGVQAQEIMLGSLFIRSFSQQLGSTAPLVDDPNKFQFVHERSIEVNRIFGLNNTIDTSILTTKHPIKPFIVDPRIDSSVRPIVNRICAPFLKDKSQTKIFGSTTGSTDNLKRPYIEKVITTRYNNNNLTLNQGNDVITGIFNAITADPSQTDQDLVAAVADPLGQLYSSEVKIFSDYIKIIQIVVDKLIESINNIQKLRLKINFEPIPSPTGGVEDGTNGGKLNTPIANDINNRAIETQIIQLTQKQILNDIQFDTGLNGAPDLGDFVFSNLDDSVFSINKNVDKSYQSNLDSLNNNRNTLGNYGIDYLRNIEIIMGEFSGFGLIDMIAMQAALWIMDPLALLGLIDTRAIQRIADYRPDININGVEDSDIPDVVTSLASFESTLLNIYQFIQKYYDNVNNGTVLIAQ
jgi:hypothetical protein